MEKPQLIEGTILSINNKVSQKGVPYAIYKVSNLEGKEQDLFKWDNNFKLLNRFCKFEIESTEKDGKKYDTIISVQEVKKESL